VGRRAALLAVVAGLLLTAGAPAAVAQPPTTVAQPPAAVAQPLAAQPPPVAQPAVPPPTSTPFQTPDTSACPNRTAPPPAVDLSEAPAPGQPSPTPLPVRKEAIGGDRMAGCGLVLPDAGPALPEGLSAHAWLVADFGSGQVLAARNPHGRHRPASTIKVLTALLALRELDLRTEVAGTDADASQEGSRVGIGPQGVYTVDQLLHGLLMRSGNDAAHALAVQLGGVPATVSKMNALARLLGAQDTRAATPSGLDGPGSSTSAYDLALIFRAAVREPELAAIMGTKLIDFPGFQEKPGFQVGSDNKLLANYPGALGGKTGFTDDARHTYVGAAKRDGRRLLVVLLRGEQQPVRMWEQAARLLDYGFALPASTAPVGVLVDRAPAEPAPSAQAGGEVTRAAEPVASGPAAVAQPTDGRRTFYVAALALIAVSMAAALWLRRARGRRGLP